MRRDRRVFQSKKLAGKRPMALEPLEAKLNLAGFGFQDLIGGFVFTIEGSDNADRGVIFTNNATLDTGFIVQWNDGNGTCTTLQGSYSAGDVANEASDRGFGVGDFKGNNIKLMGGDDVFTGNGSNASLNPVTPCSSATVSVGPLVGNGILTIAGNGGKDSLTGSPGPDDISGGADNDTIISGDGEDTIDGSVGNDVIDSGNDEDLVNGGDGKDSISAGGGDDTVNGGPGDDTISGGGGNDTLNGDDGNDDIRGDAGADDISGGAGNDAILGDNEDKNPEGGDGTDAYQRGDTGDLTKGIVIVNADIEKIDTTGKDPGDPNDGFKGSAGFGGDFAGGNISAPDSVDSTTWVGPGNGITIISGGGNDTIIGGSGRDSLDAGAGDDLLVGKDSVDTLRGGDGDDFLQGDAAADVIDGGNGFDKSSYKDSPEAVQASSTCQLDTQLQALAGAMNPIAGPDCGRLGHAQDDAFTSIEGLIGSNFNDTLFAASAGGGMVDGGGGDDIIWGGQDDDMLDGGDGNDTIKGFDGNDTLGGGKGNDTLLGGNGNDILLGGGDDDDLNGEADTDAYAGGTGDDTLRMAYNNGSLEDLRNVGTFQGAVYGDLGQDNFLVSGASSANDQLDVRFELADAETKGLADFQANDDDLNFN